ncbi:MAG: DsrE family protein [Gammaproteobacteria bacterium]|nr:DsrE family protein [Gammaproteobacteria bacterium]
MLHVLFISVLMLTAPNLQAQERENARWGFAREVERTYTPSKVVYDLSSGSVDQLADILDRASFLSTVYEADPFEASIVIVIHGSAIPFFTTGAYPTYRELMERAQSLTVGNIVEFRMCRASAKSMGVASTDVHGFVTMVPMADAEIVELNRDGYVYMK